MSRQTLPGAKLFRPKKQAEGPSSQTACLHTPAGTIEYTLVRKRVKNLNLRVRADGSVALSVPLRMPAAAAEDFVRRRAEWIVKHRQRMAAAPPQTPCRYTKQECLVLFGQVSDRVFPLFADILKGEKPLLKVRDMKTRWGVCNPKTRTITLNMRLAEQAPEAIEYVVLHEYVHFLHPDHQAGFHAEMARLMPDYRQRRRLLRRGCGNPEQA